MGKEAKLDTGVFRDFSIETLKHISQFCTSVPGMISYIEERLPKGVLLEKTDKVYHVIESNQSIQSPDDTIAISDDGTLLHL